MPPRFAYWTILIDRKPTAFRAHEQEELLPTFHQLKRTNKDVILRWFARGKLWESPDAERAAWRGRNASGAGSPRDRAKARGRDWRPGGQHRDPRQQFRDQKKQRNQERRAARHDRREKPFRPRGSKSTFKKDRRRFEETPPPRKHESPEQPPLPEQIVIKSEPPERG